MDDLRNVSYVFIPLSFGAYESFRAVVDELNRDPGWTLVHDEITYMLKYVADKINSRDQKNCQCFHYQLNGDVRRDVCDVSQGAWYTLKGRIYKGEPEEFPFQILSIQLYCFSTTVCILAIKVTFQQNDPYWVSSALYYLKKVSREKIYPQNGECEPFTLLELAKRAMSTMVHFDDLTFFYYANPSTERANILTYLETDSMENVRHQLYYLRRCYSEGFLYWENSALDKEELYVHSQDIIWGISPEAAACLTCGSFGREKFIRGTFYKNFNAQYLFMYVLLLHQKYVLYLFLTRIGIGTYNNLEMLEEYRSHLYEFETDFVFSCVTEVPQYQNLYDRMTRAFSLETMYKDVHEPLTALSDVRRISNEEKQQNRDKNMNRALVVLSLLSLFSALVDSFDFIQSFFGWFLNDTGVKVAQVICICAIVITTLYIFKMIWDSRKN